MARLSDEKIQLIQKLYATYGIYSKVAKEVGCSPATVKKYCAVSPVTTPKDVPKFIGEPLPIEEIVSPLTRNGWLQWCEFDWVDMASVESLQEEL